MNIVKTLQVDSISSSDTEKLGASIAKYLKGGECIELTSDLGGGKTTFVRGFVAQTGSTDKVASPTFTISRVYKTPKFDIHHFDFYRLADAGLAVYELDDLIDDPEIVILIEWGGVVEDVLPPNRMVIDIRRTGDETRQLSIRYPEALSYLVQDVPGAADV